MLVARAPTRLDFGGGWTDVPPYAPERGGFVCNLAIARYATVTFDVAATRADARAVAVDAPPLVLAALRKASMSGAQVHLSSDFPVGAGLGGSSAAGVALAAVLATEQRTSLDRAHLAEWSRAVEVEEMHIAGGRQDHYAAAFGGALGLTFGTTTIVERLLLTASTIAALERRCLLAYTGESRMSATTITAVLDAYRARDARVLYALDRMGALARQMRDAVAAGDIDALAALVDEHWVHQRSLHPRISTARIDALGAAARAVGALGMKALGASGGGCVIVFTDEADEGQVANAIAPWASVMNWRVASDGVSVYSDTEGSLR